MKKQAKKTETTESTPEVFPVQNIAVKSIDPSPANKRIFPKDNKSLQELGESIKAQGLLQAIVIRKSPKKKGRRESRIKGVFSCQGRKNISQPLNLPNISE